MFCRPADLSLWGVFSLLTIGIVIGASRGKGHHPLRAGRVFSSVCARMKVPSDEPLTTHVRLEAGSCFKEYRGDDRFSITRVQSTCPLPEPIHKSGSVAALLVSVSVRPLAARGYQLWVDGRIVPTRAIPAFRTNVVDFAAAPACWADAGFDYVHFQVRRAAIDDVAHSLGYDPIGGFRLSVLENDIVLAQMTKSVLPILGQPAACRTSPSTIWSWFSART